MKRRSFFAAAFLFSGIIFAGITAKWIRTGDSASYIYAILTIIYIAWAGMYQLHPKPIGDPDEPAPREWFVLAGLVALVLLGSTLLLLGSALLLRDSVLLLFVVVG
ncbi:hypothetical protein [Halohasta salina]|uniref:hypothetical protein n=1 Tax=Halohasta salina TaxID=2961621 RepID=UPI0020A49F9C|nr:hypothetical protein [Halohasta salina]